MCVSLFAAVVSLNASTIYQVVDLGSLGGPASAATAIDNLGNVAGWSLLLDGQTTQAYRTSGFGAPQSLGTGSRISRAQGLGDDGFVVGVQYDGDGDAFATRWSPGGLVENLGDADSYALALNRSGIIAGSQSGHAVTWTATGQMVDLGVTAPWSSAYAINGYGAVAGTLQLANRAFRAFTTDGAGGVTTLGTLGGANSYGTAINNQGWVAGASTVAQGYLHAFLYAQGRLTDLGTLDGLGSSAAYGMNDAGQVVGYSQRAGGGQSAFLYQGGVMQDLNSLIAVDSGWRLLEASAINGRGQIVGFGMLGGMQRAFRLDPVLTTDKLLLEDVPGGDVPEPGTITLLALGLAGVMFGLARRSEQSRG